MYDPSHLHSGLSSPAGKPCWDLLLQMRWSYWYRCRPMSDSCKYPSLFLLWMYSLFYKTHTVQSPYRCYRQPPPSRLVSSMDTLICLLRLKMLNPVSSTIILKDLASKHNLHVSSLQRILMFLRHGISKEPLQPCRTPPLPRPQPPIPKAACAISSDNPLRFPP